MHLRRPRRTCKSGAAVDRVQKVSWIVVGMWICLGGPPWAWGQSPEEEWRRCLECHANPALPGYDEQGRPRSVFVDEKALKASVHRSLRCTQCHTDIDPRERFHPRYTKPVECGACHLERRLPQAPAFPEAIFKSYADSIHGEAAARGDPDAPRCADCHGHHDIQRAEAPSSRVARANIPQTCSRCHSDPQVVASHRIPKGQTLLYYLNSVHGRLLQEEGRGPKPSAVCTDCHGVHGIRPASDPNSQVARPHLPSTCGQCHRSIEEEWRRSVHGQAWARGIKAAPLCTDCHGEHNIRSPQDPLSSVYPTHVVVTCSRCHENALLQRRLGLPTLRLSTYRRSFHGIMNRYGVSQVAHCASCHGAHNILPSSDPRSSIHPSNLPQTCGRCHPGIGKGVSLGQVHLIGTRTANPLYWMVKVLYQALILALVGFFVVYVALDLLNYARGRPSHALPRPRPDDPLAQQYVERFTPSEKWQHIVLVLSFTLLMVSGMPLSHPEAAWAERLLSFPGGTALRGILHRIGAVMLMGLSLWHLLYLTTPRGKEQLRALLPTRKDFADILQMLRCYLGLSRQKPRFGRFSWIEKFEYYAVVWGSAIMVLTGLLMWFEAWALQWLPLWAWHVARLVHSYEALLAFLAIIVWHLYHVHFKPGVFPMSWVWLTGRISLRHLEEEHPLEFEALQEGRGQEESRGEGRKEGDDRRREGAEGSQ